MGHAANPPVVEDRQLFCPACGYNLTGLTDTICPECGGRFEWAEVERLAREGRVPFLAFEGWTGWRKAPGFVVTWLTVLFAPWVFARQITSRVSGWHGLAFVTVCFASTALGFVYGMDRPFWGAWLGAATAYILAQAVLLGLLDPALYRRPWATLRFWLLVGCYTSAVMPTETVHAPPLIELGSLVKPATWTTSTWVWPRIGNEVAWLAAAQLALWLAAVLCCVWWRWRLAGFGRRAASLVVVLATPAVFALYVLAVNGLGVKLFGWLHGPLWP